MNDSNDPVDRFLADAARRRHQDVVATVTPSEIEGALADLHRRAELEPDDSAPPNSSPALRGRRTAWILAAAAAVVLAVTGVVVLTGGERDDTIVTDTIAPVPSTDPDDPGPTPTTVDVPDPSIAPSTPTTAAPTTAAPTASSTDVVSTTVLPVGPQTIAVDAGDPPPLVEPAPFGVIGATPDDLRLGWALGPDAAHVVIGDQLVVVPLDGGDQVVVELPEQMSQPVIGPEGILYAFGEVVPPEPGEPLPGPLPLHAVAIEVSPDGLTGRGTIVATELLDTIAWLELPDGAIGLGPDGIVGRSRQVGETLIGYVDAQGSALDPTSIVWPDGPPSVVRTEETTSMPDVSVERIGVDDGPSWILDVTRSSDAGSSFVGPSPAAPIGTGRVVAHRRIGSAIDPEADFSANRLPVVAVLRSDGSGEWVRLPDDWSVVAVDLDGVLAIRAEPGSPVIELARLDDLLPMTPDVVPEDVDAADGDVGSGPVGTPVGIEARCVGFSCTSLGARADGTIVATNPGSDELLVQQGPGLDPIVVATEAPLGATSSAPQIVAVGPDDVAYVWVLPSDAVDPVADLYAIATAGPSAGATVRAWPAAVDASGDSDLVVTAEGLVAVGCCGPDLVRPAPDAEVRFPWLDSQGEPTTWARPTFRVELGDAGDRLVRIEPDGTESRFVLPTVARSVRGVPTVVATDDGGALMSVFDMTTSRTYLVRFEPGASSDTIGGDQVFLPGVARIPVLLLRGDGTVAYTAGPGPVVTAEPGQIADPGWPGSAEVDTQAATVSAPGLNDHVDANRPVWAGEPSTFALALVPSVGPNEYVVVQQLDGDLSGTDGTSGTFALTIEGLLDDSVGAVRYTLDLRRADDGLIRLEAADWSQRCRRGVDTETFTTDLCP